ncbi:MAG: hypothetical protein IJ240_05455 [Clostridia bacterium]|nr:hypothetical protein [Clostridia bacterium]
MPVRRVLSLALSGSRDLEDTTRLDAGDAATYAPDLLPGGLLAVRGLRDPADPGQKALAALLASGTEAAFRARLPEGGEQTFPGLVASLVLRAAANAPQTEWEASIRLGE